MKVSWQVTGVRTDRWAQANPIEVEEEKSGEERGRFVHPELYGEPEERGIHKRAIPAEMGRMEEEERPLPHSPQPLGTDLAHLEEERRRLEDERMRGLGQQQPPQTPSPPETDFARLEEEHRRRTEEVRRQMEEVQRRMEGGEGPPEAT